MGVVISRLTCQRDKKETERKRLTRANTRSNRDIDRSVVTGRADGAGKSRRRGKALRRTVSFQVTVHETQFLPSESADRVDRKDWDSAPRRSCLKGSRAAWTDDDIRSPTARGNEIFDSSKIEPLNKDAVKPATNVLPAHGRVIPARRRLRRRHTYNGGPRLGGTLGGTRVAAM